MEKAGISAMTEAADAPGEPGASVEPIAGDGRVRRPIFLIGPSRSGSTILMEAFAMHEDLAWFSNYNNRFPAWAWTSLVHRVYDLPGFTRMGRGEKRQFKQGRGLTAKFLPKPGECFRKWNYLWGKDFDAKWRFFADATPQQADRIRRGVHQAQKWQGKPRFVEKLTGPGRVQFLHSVFPDATFVHLDRESYPLVLSGAKYYYDTRRPDQRRNPPWMAGIISHYEDFWKKYDYDIMAGSAYMLRLGREMWEREKVLLAPDRRVEVRYEELMADPVPAMRNLMAACGLPPSQRVDGYVGKPGRYRNMNFKAEDKLSPQQRAVIDEVLALPAETFFPGGK